MLDVMTLRDSHVQVTFVSGRRLTGVVADWYCLIPYGVYRRLYLPRLAVRESEVVALTADQARAARTENAATLADWPAAVSPRREPSPASPPRICDACGVPVRQCDYDLCTRCKRQRDKDGSVSYTISDGTRDDCGGDDGGC
jgi:hypothetical protein